MLPWSLVVNFGPNEIRILHSSHCCFHFVLLCGFSCFMPLWFCCSFICFCFFFLTSLNGKRSRRVLFYCMFSFLQGTLHEGFVCHSIHIASVYSLLVPCVLLSSNGTRIASTCLQVAFSVSAMHSAFAMVRSLLSFIKDF